MDVEDFVEAAKENEVHILAGRRIFMPVSYCPLPRYPSYFICCLCWFTLFIYSFFYYLIQPLVPAEYLEPSNFKCLPDKELVVAQKKSKLRKDQLLFAYECFKRSQVSADDFDALKAFRLMVRYALISKLVDYCRIQKKAEFARTCGTQSFLDGR